METLNHNKGIDQMIAKYSAAFAMSLAATGPAIAGDALTVSEACSRSSNIPPAICICLGETAEAELSEIQRAFVIAVLNENEAETLRLRGVIPPVEMVAAAMFMVNAPAECVRAGSG